MNGTSFSHYVNTKEPEAKPSYTVYADPEDPTIAKDEGKVWTRTKKVSKVNAPLSVFREEVFPYILTLLTERQATRQEKGQR